MKLYFTTMELPTGVAAAAATDKGLTRLSLKPGGIDGFLDGLESEFGVKAVHDERPFTALKRELSGYFRGEPVAFTSRLDLRGTEFQKKVWEELMKIPYGNVRSYGWLARTLGNPKAARAVGGALNKNRIPILIPCHRVVEASGSLGGFECGLDVKVKLLQVEGVFPAGSQ